MFNRHLLIIFATFFVLFASCSSNKDKKGLGESCVSPKECASGHCSQVNGKYICTDGQAKQNCVPGATQKCVCPTGKEGSQVCNAQGTGWETCQCAGGNGQICTPNATQQCICQNGSQGLQTCNPTGSGWGICVCGGQNKICTPNSTRTCSCANNQQGQQTCQSDGKSWGPCQCGNSNGKKGLGQGPCTKDSECQQNLCMILSDRSYCTQTCNGKCPQGFSCAFYKKRQVCGKIRPNAKPIGGACKTSFDCQSILCLPDGTCSQRCDFDPCPNGYSCVNLTQNFKICTPDQGKGLCSQTEIFRHSNCISQCQGNQTCEINCYGKHLNKKCEKCYLELSQCGNTNNCTPVRDPNCCQAKRLECFGY